MQLTDRRFTMAVIALLVCTILPVTARQDAVAVPVADLNEGHRLFYAGNYDAAIAIAGARLSEDPDDLAARELRTSALHFQMRRALGDGEDKGKALKACATCGPLLAMFLEDTRQGQAIARAKVKAAPDDDEALFFVGKINLNYVWLQLGTLGRKTGWGEYWEARHSLDALLKRRPDHVRGRVARAWIDYIVDTRLPLGFRWMLGGGDKKRALVVVREASNSQADEFAKVEAQFALWDMLVREKQLVEAVETAHRIAVTFPENAEIAKFIAKHPHATPPAAR